MKKSKGTNIAIETPLAPNTVILRLTGSLNDQALALVEDQFKSLLPRCFGHKVILDLSKAPSIGRSGWTLILRFFSNIRALGGELLLVARNQEILAAFNALHYGRFIRHFQILADALGAEPSLPPLETPSAKPSARRPNRGWKALMPSHLRRRLSRRH
jgi:anti-anti-sigma factor